MSYYPPSSSARTLSPSAETTLLQSLFSVGTQTGASGDDVRHCWDYEAAARVMENMELLEQAYARWNRETNEGGLADECDKHLQRFHRIRVAVHECDSSFQTPAGLQPTNQDLFGEAKALFSRLGPLARKELEATLIKTLSVNGLNSSGGFSQNSVQPRSLSDPKGSNESATEADPASGSSISVSNNLFGDSIASLNPAYNQSQAVSPSHSQERTDIQRISRVLSLCSSLQDRFSKAPLADWSDCGREKYIFRCAEYGKAILAIRSYQKRAANPWDRIGLDSTIMLNRIVDLIKATVNMYRAIIQNELEKSPQDPVLEKLEKACECIRYWLGRLRNVADGEILKEYRCICDGQRWHDMPVVDFAKNVPACAEAMWEELDRFHNRYQSELPEVAKYFFVA